MVGVTFVILTNGKNLGEYSEILHGVYPERSDALTAAGSIRRLTGFPNRYKLFISRA